MKSYYGRLKMKKSKKKTLVKDWATKKQKKNIKPSEICENNFKKKMNKFYKKCM